MDANRTISKNISQKPNIHGKYSLNNKQSLEQKEKFKECIENKLSNESINNITGIKKNSISYYANEL